MAEVVPPPQFVQIEPVGQCNLRCKMCPVQFRSDGPPGPSAFMPFDRFCKLIDQFGAVAELHLQGLGEPLLHPRFFDMVRYASERGIQVSTNTNMTIMTTDHAAQCVTSGLHTLHVSLDGASAESYEAIRVRARFDRVLRNLRRLMAARAAAASEWPQVGLVAVAMRQNIDQLPQLVRLAHAEGVQSLSVQRLCHDFGEASLPERYRPMRQFIDDQSLLIEDHARIEAIFSEARAELIAWASRYAYRDCRHICMQAMFPAANDATGHGAAPISATTARLCPAAWWQRRIASISAIWRKTVWNSCGITKPISAFVHSFLRLRRPMYAVAAPYIPALSD